MSSQSSRRDSVLIHKSGDVVGNVFPSELFTVIGGTKITRVEDVNISLVNDFIVGIAEKAEPVFNLIEGFREENEVRTIVGSGFDVDSSEFDAFRVYKLRFAADVGDGGEAIEAGDVDEFPHF